MAGAWRTLPKGFSRLGYYWLCGTVKALSSVLLLPEAGVHFIIIVYNHCI